MYRILIANGVNLDLLGSRPSGLYGKRTLADLEVFLREECARLESFLDAKIELSFFQSNDEVKYLEKLGESWDGALLNPGAWTHTSLALADRLEALNLPFIEVHLSQLAKRESYRQHSYLSAHALGVIHGLGFDSYLVALHALIRHLALDENSV
jgi:3-dehydroquinate dehydratase-2